MRPRIAIPIPTSFDPDYNNRCWPQYAHAVERSGGDAVPVPLLQPPAETARLIASCSAILLPGSGADVNPQKFNQPTHVAAAPPDPARENVDELLLQDAHNMGKPILAVCFGAQMLNVWRGGSLLQDIPTHTVAHKAGRDVLEAHPIEVAPNTLLSRILIAAEAGGSTPQSPAGPSSAEPAPVFVNSSHHQSVATPGDGLRIAATSPQDGIIEAIEGIQSDLPAPASPLDPAHIPTHHSSAHKTAAWSPFILGIQWHPERTFDHSAASRALFARLVTEAAAWSPRLPT